MRGALLTGNNLNPRAWALDLEKRPAGARPAPSPARAVQCRAGLNILAHTRRISHFDQIEQIKDYPDQVRKLLAPDPKSRLTSCSKRII